MKNIILYGASNYGLEVADTIADINRSASQPPWQITGFIDDNPDVQGKTLQGIPVLGSKDWLTTHPIGDYAIVCCIGSPHAKQKIIPFLEGLGATFATLIHPSAIISSKATIGAGCIIMAGSIISTSARIADHVIINLACTIGHNTTIGTYSCINPGSNISGDVTLGEGVLAGTNATVLERLQIGAYAKLGASSMVYTDVPEKASIIGVPGRIMKISS
jgi:sugar O-acyltransferase (sialic acid O-acetyltransferase NeuD family)